MLLLLSAKVVKKIDATKEKYLFPLYFARFALPLHSKAVQRSVAGVQMHARGKSGQHRTLHW